MEINEKEIVKQIAKIIILAVLIICTPILISYICANFVFQDLYSDKYTSIIVTQFLWWDIAMLVIFIIITIISAIFTTRFVKKEKEPKWSHIIWIAFSIICIWQAKNISDVILDIKSESYVVYQGEFSQNNGGYSLDVKTTRLMPDDIRLKSRESLIESGYYTGTVIYTERSEIAVEVKDVIPK